MQASPAAAYIIQTTVEPGRITPLPMYAAYHVGYVLSLFASPESTGTAYVLIYDRSLPYTCLRI